MIINIKHKGDLITLDLRAKQIRYINNFEERGEIEFSNIFSADVGGYEYLFNNDKQMFLKTLKEDLLNFLGKKVLIKGMEILKGGLKE